MLLQSPDRMFNAALDAAYAMLGRRVNLSGIPSVPLFGYTYWRLILPYDQFPQAPHGVDSAETTTL